ncbi:major capsid protein [Comamonas koreensis]|uniref:major capsid protein n=1 Tax=Comamonas koreensis TaxID=160825 RepID=UPI0015FD9B3C|nr:major capsid protein [Comamonas koreensis]
MSKFAIARLGQKAKLVALAATAGALTIAQPAMAEVIDVAAVVTDVKAQIGAVVLLGGAVLLVYAAVKAFKWVRSAMS